MRESVRCGESNAATRLTTQRRKILAAVNESLIRGATHQHTVCELTRHADEAILGCSAQVNIEACIDGVRVDDREAARDLINRQSIHTVYGGRYDPDRIDVIARAEVAAGDSDVDRLMCQVGRSGCAAQRGESQTSERGWRSRPQRRHSNGTKGRKPEVPGQHKKEGKRVTSENHL